MASSAVPSTSHHDMPVVNTSLETLSGIDSSSTPNSSRVNQAARGRGRGKGNAVYQGNMAKKSKLSKKRLQPEAAEEEEEEGEGAAQPPIRGQGRKEAGQQNRNNNRRSEERREEEKEEEKDDVEFLREERPQFIDAPLGELIKALNSISFAAMKQHERFQTAVRAQCQEAEVFEKRCRNFDEERKKYLDRIAELERENAMLKAANGQTVTSSTSVADGENSKYQALLSSLGYTSPIVKKERITIEDDPYGILRALGKK
jgi:hypothetical protein